MASTTEYKAGLFLILGLTLLAVSIIVLGGERQIFAKQISFKSSFTDVAGLAEGAQVRLGGIAVGRVDSIHLSKTENDNNVYVNFLVNRIYSSKITDETTVSIETQGLLGDKYLSLTPGSTGTVLTDGATITSVSSGDLGETIKKVQVVLENAATITKGVGEIITHVRDNVLVNVAKTSAAFADISSNIKDGDGLLHELVYSKEHATNIMSSISEASISVKDAAGQAKEAITKLNSASESLQSAGHALSSGEGTIGALLIDPSLYENLVEVTDEAKRSFLLRSAIRSSLNK